MSTRSVPEVFYDLFAPARYLAEVMQKLVRPPYRISETFKQIDYVANQSLVIVVFCVCFAAMVTILESSYHMRLVVQNASLVPGFASLLILRELGAVNMSLLLTSRVGAGMAAEISTMKITEQLDALRLLGIDPIKFLVIPRFIACAISGVILSAFSNIVCLIGAMVVSQIYLGYTAQGFITVTKNFIHFQDLVFALIKGGIFSAVIPLVACYCGFRCEGGAEGVGQSTTQSVVISSVSIIFLDFVLSAFFTLFY
jgi:phospholipid/cholesterol/gamma-HCH transport system permease protein